MNWRTLFLISILVLRPLQGAEILVFAAASLSDVLSEIGRNYQKASGEKVKFSFAASSVLARQIQEGARAEVFFSADDEKMDQIEGRGLILRETRRTLLSNTLVVVTPEDGKLVIKTPEDLKQARRLAIAQPQTVPAGIYARQYLERAGVWNDVHVVPTENVRAALAAVESGNVDAAIVFKTDAAMSRKVKVSYEIETLGPVQIRYPAAVLTEAKNPSAGKAFIEYLASQESSHVFENYGFIALTAGKGRAH